MLERLCVVIFNFQFEHKIWPKLPVGFISKLVEQNFNYFRLGALGFTLNEGNSIHRSLHVLSKSEIRTGRVRTLISLLNKQKSSKSKDNSTLAWAKIVLYEFDKALNGLHAVLLKDTRHHLIFS